KGVGVHPHRGFETVTIAYKGAVQHADSSGGGGIIKEGDVQWMTAASGILHKEFHEEEWSKKGGIFQMVQLWVNLPKKYKMSPPKYQAITADKMGKYFLEDKESYIEVIAGNYKEIKGAASTFTPIHLMNAKLKVDAIASFNFPDHYTTAILVIEGNVKVEDKEIPTDHFVLMAKDGETFTIKASEDAIVLVMSGEPINEPIVSHGPFVMNSSEELIEAFNDFNNGKFGHLE
ncbi:MAG TPA: pirin family protein, partial [Chitinophagaceae bacterium]|nr:pirin family protein [Chitinophagaceae bacterium]